MGVPNDPEILTLEMETIVSAFSKLVAAEDAAAADAAAASAAADATADADRS